jgi:hypothetical protein
MHAVKTLCAHGPTLLILILNTYLLQHPSACTTVGEAENAAPNEAHVA